MAIVKGALFSIAASGTLGNLIEFNASQFRQSVRLKPNIPKAASNPQLAIRQRMKDCAITWRLLSSLDQLQWKNLVIGKQTTPYAKFTLEYHAQNSTPQTPPMIPMA